MKKKARDKGESGRRKKYSDLAVEFKILIFTIYFADSSYSEKGGVFFRIETSSGMVFFIGRVEWNLILYCDT